MCNLKGQGGRIRVSSCSCLTCFAMRFKLQSVALVDIPYQRTGLCRGKIERFELLLISFPEKKDLRAEFEVRRHAVLFQILSFSASDTGPSLPASHFFH